MVDLKGQWSQLLVAAISCFSRHNFCNSTVSGELPQESSTPTAQFIWNRPFVRAVQFLYITTSKRLLIKFMFNCPWVGFSYYRWWLEVKASHCNFQYLLRYGKKNTHFYDSGSPQPETVALPENLDGRGGLWPASHPLFGHTTDPRRNWFHWTDVCV